MVVVGGGRGSNVALHIFRLIIGIASRRDEVCAARVGGAPVDRAPPRPRCPTPAWMQRPITFLAYLMIEELVIAVPVTL